MCNLKAAYKEVEEIPGQDGGYAHAWSLSPSQNTLLHNAYGF